MSSLKADYFSLVGMIFFSCVHFSQKHLRCLGSRLVAFAARGAIPLSSLLYPSFPRELSPSYFPRFPVCPPCRLFNLASSQRSSPQAISHSFPSLHPVVASVSLLPNGGLPWSEMEATTRWTEGKPWEIAWGEFGKGRDGSVDMVDGRETVGNSLLRWEDTAYWEAELARVSGQVPSMRLSWKTVRPWLFKWFAIVGRWDMHSFVGREGDAKNAQLLARVFQDKFHQYYNCSEKLHAQDLPKFPNPGPWDMHSFVGREGN